MNDQLKDKVKKIIADNIYVTIATTGKNGLPWVSPVYSAHDEKYNFYWISPKNTLHSRNIYKNNHVAIVIFDSKAPEGTGEGVYMKATASEIVDEKEILKAAKLIYGSRDKTPRPVSHFTGKSPRRLYKAIPQKFWINSGEEVNGYYNDSRIEVDL